MLIVTYDEHGGFFDHVPPPPIVTQPPAGASYPAFASLGVRVPGLVISPLVSAQTVFHDVMDHLSILKFLGEKFNSGSYSPEVDARPVASVSAVLNLAAPRTDIPYPAPAQVGSTPGAPTLQPLPSAFANAWQRIKQQHLPEAITRFPELTHRF